MVAVPAEGGGGVEEVVAVIPAIADALVVPAKSDGGPLPHLTEVEGRVLDSCPMPDVPAWTRPIVQRVRQMYG